MKTSTSFFAKIGLTAGALIGAVALSALAQTSGWTSAPANPPSGNVPAPINVGAGVPVLGSFSGQEKTDSLAIDGNLALMGKLIIPYGASTTNGAVLTTDGNGDVSWGTAAGGSGGSIVYIPPVTIATIGASTAPWTTVSLSQYGIPSNASAVVLQASGHYFCNNGCNNSQPGLINVRASSAASSYIAFMLGTSGNSTAVNGISEQGIFPISSSGSIDYQVSQPFTNGAATLSIIGYITGGPSQTVYVGGVTSITAGGNITVSGTGPNGTGNVTINTTATQSTGTVGGGCYVNSTNNKYGTPTSYACWGNGQTDPSNPANTPTCPSGYTIQGVNYDINLLGSSYISSYLCIKN